MDRGTWRATVHRLTKNQMQLKRLSMHTRHHGCGYVLFDKCALYHKSMNSVKAESIYHYLPQFPLTLSTTFST